MITDINLNPLPYRKQCFSGTDLKKDINNPGICFPLKEATNQPSFSSIIEHEQGTTIMAHTEYRIVNNTKTSVDYSEGRSLAIINSKKDIFRSEAEKLILNLQDEHFDTTYLNIKHIDSSFPLIQGIKGLLDTLEYEPEFFIDSNNLTKKVHSDTIDKLPSTKEYYSYIDNEFILTKSELNKLDNKELIYKIENFLYYAINDLEHDLYPFYDSTSKEVKDLNDYIKELTTEEQNTYTNEELISRYTLLSSKVQEVFKAMYEHCHN